MNTKNNEKNLANSVYFRILIFGCLIGIIAYHLHSFYRAVWDDKSIAVFWTITHSGLAIYLLLKDNAFESGKASGAVTIYTIALTYILHTNILRIDSYSFVGLNTLIMKTLIIAIVLAGVFGLATTFSNSKKTI